MKSRLMGEGNLQRSIILSKQEYVPLSANSFTVIIMDFLGGLNKDGQCGMNGFETENRGVEDNLFREIVTAMQNIPVYDTTNITVKYLEPGIAGAEMVVAKEFENSRGLLHGGFIAALADTVMGLSMLTLGSKGVTLDLNINYLAPVQIGTKLLAEGHVLHAGKNTLVAEASVYDSDKVLVAKSRGTFFKSER